MIKIKELNLGNLVLIDERITDTSTQVVGVVVGMVDAGSPDDILVQSITTRENYSVGEKDIDPINLDPSIFIKYGFHERKEVVTFQTELKVSYVIFFDNDKNDMYRLIIDPSIEHGWVAYFSVSNNGGDYSELGYCMPNTLHELQNYIKTFTHGLTL